MFYLGLDIGSSSVKAALIDQITGQAVAVVSEPETEMAINAPELGWAEQDPESWWQHSCTAIKRLLKEQNIDGAEVNGVGIAYQMHGLVAVDINGKLVRDSIIWCDSRAVQIGKQAFQNLGAEFCAEHFLNSPANFTASKLKWVKENEPEKFAQIHKIMLPGDYISYRFSGEINTTLSGLSEGILWDFKVNKPARALLDHYGINEDLLPTLVDTFSRQAEISETGAKDSGLAKGTPILYRAGDQPNNALSLNVMKPGEVAATGGTSGVVYAVTDRTDSKETSRINSFAHVNYTVEKPIIGQLLNINGAGILYRWLKETLGVSSYVEMNRLAGEASVGARGAVIIPFGNGAERMLENEMPGMHLANINFNVHDRRHLCRAALEGIAFAFIYGMEILMDGDREVSVVRAGNDNLFRSQLFAETVATLLGKEIEIYNTTGAIGAARAAGLAAGTYDGLDAVMKKSDHVETIKPLAKKDEYQEAYQIWKNELIKILK
ncbi:MAG: FGGY family carbohydrate kinase [Leeuwenhoekiella sp.]